MPNPDSHAKREEGLARPPALPRNAQPSKADGASSRPAGEKLSDELRQLERRSEELKTKIEQQRRDHDMPIDSSLGDPNWQEKAADGRFDRPDEDDES
jgi:hypothetical protein